jgi:hypothetical protein
MVKGIMDLVLYEDIIRSERYGRQTSQAEL